MSRSSCRLAAVFLLLASSLAAGDAPPPTLELLGRWRQGPVYSSAVAGEHLFFGSGGAIRILETNEDASAWQEVASIETAGICVACLYPGSICMRLTAAPH